MINEEIEKRKIGLSQPNTTLVNNGNIAIGNNNNQAVNGNLIINKQQPEKTSDSILRKYWWGLLIPIICGIALIAIEYKWFIK